MISFSSSGEPKDNKFKSGDVNRAPSSEVCRRVFADEKSSFRLPLSYMAVWELDVVGIISSSYNDASIHEAGLAKTNMKISWLSVQGLLRAYRNQRTFISVENHSYMNCVIFYFSPAMSSQIWLVENLNFVLRRVVIGQLFVDWFARDIRHNSYDVSRKTCRKQKLYFLGYSKEREFSIY